MPTTITRPKQAVRGDASATWRAIAIVLAGLVVRIWLFDRGEHGMDAFAFRDWMWNLVSHPLSTFYDQHLEVFQDHLPGDMLLFWGMARGLKLLDPGFDLYGHSTVILLKCVWMAFDLGISLQILLIARRYTSVGRARLIAALAFINPVLIVDGAIWGQSDSVAAFWFLVGLNAYLRRRLPLTALFLTICLLTKPYYGIAAIVLGVHWWADTGRRRSLDGALRDLLMPALVALVAATLVCWPFGVSLLPGLSRWSLWDRLSLSLNLYPYTNVGGFNLWAIASGRGDVRDDRLPLLGPLTAHQMGLILFLVVFVSLVWSLIRVGASHRYAALANGLTLGFFAYFIVSTRMHERYLFPAAILVFLIPIWQRRRWAELTALCLLTAANSYLALAWSAIDPAFALPRLHLLRSDTTVRLLSLAMVALFCVMYARWLRRAGLSGAEE